jgi:hypothetical protein
MCGGLFTHQVAVEILKERSQRKAAAAIQEKALAPIPAEQKPAASRHPWIPTFFTMIVIYATFRLFTDDQINTERRTVYCVFSFVGVMGLAVHTYWVRRNRLICTTSENAGAQK